MLPNENMKANKLQGVLIAIAFLSTPAIYAKESGRRSPEAVLASNESTDPVAEGYALLQQMQAAKAIHKLTSPFISALRQQDHKRAAGILRLIAFAFRVDENDECAAQTALNAVALDPSSDAAKMDAASYLYRCGEWKRARAISENLHKSKDAAIATLAYAQDCLRKVEYSKGISAITGAPEKVQSNLKVMKALALLYQMDEDLKSSSSVYEKLAGACANDYMKEIYLGRSRTVVMDTDGARAHFKAAGRVEADDPLWMSELGILEMKKGNIKEAREYFRSAVGQERLSSQAHLNLAILEAYFGSTQDAQAALNRISKLRPAGSDVAFAIGLVSEKLEDWQEARIAFTKVLTLHPFNSSAYQHLLSLARQMKKPSDELDIAARWLQANPASFLAHVEAGKTYYLNGDKEKSLRCFDKAMQFASKRALATRSSSKGLFLTLLAFRSAANHELGKSDKAFEDALLFNQQKPEPAKAGGLYIRPNKIDVSKIPSGSKQLNAVKHALLGDVLYEAGNLLAAEREYKLATIDEPDNILWHSCRLKVLIDQKNFVEAAKEDLHVSQHVVTHFPDIFRRR